MPPITQIRIRRDTAANFTSANPTLALGEIAYETDTRNLKVGDGATAWTALPYINPYRAGTAAADTSNTVMGSGAGAALTSAAVDNVLIGQSAGDALTVSGGNVAIGTNALGSSNAGAASITNTTPGTGGVAGAYGGVQLEKDSGTGTMAVYPQLTVVVGAGGSVTSITITNPGSGATVASGIVFRVTSPVPAGVPSNWRGTLASVTGGNVAIGQNALALGVPTVVSRTAIGANALDAATNAPNAIAIGDNALGAVTTGANTIAIGNNAAPAYTTGTDAIVIGHGSAQTNTSDSILVIGNNSLGNYPSNVARTTIVGHGIMAAGSSSSGNDNTAIGWRAGRVWTSATGRNVAAGTEAGAYHGTGTDLNLGANSSIYIGYQSRAAANDQTNQIVIGTNVVGNGSNTTTIGNSSTTGTFIPAGNLTLTNGNFIVGTSGKGIDFSATPGTGTSELLNDYEEGTWTPTYEAATGTFTTLTMDVIGAKYIKVGKQVTVIAGIRTDNVDATGASGALRITGLPFANSSAGRSAASLGACTSWVGDTPLNALMIESTSRIDMYYRDASDTGDLAVVVADMTTGAVANQNSVYLTATYFTD